MLEAVSTRIPDPIGLRRKLSNEDIESDPAAGPKAQIEDKT